MPWVKAQVGCCRGTFVSHRQRDSVHFGCSASHSAAYSSPRIRQARGDKFSIGRCSVQEPGADWRQNTSTRTVTGIPFAAGPAGRGTQ